MTNYDTHQTILTSTVAAISRNS